MVPPLCDLGNCSIDCTCGDGTCQPTENCRNCPGDFACSCETFTPPADSRIACHPVDLAGTSVSWGAPTPPPFPTADNRCPDGSRTNPDNELQHMERLRQLFDAFTEQQQLLHLLDRCMAADGLQIFIG